mmetsp:Transcript_15472/g.45246  ORF Transcript_15472/g.45246 Transcript_15472/m.45246 type:complete len:92 (-) Transcript_15472:48-323(-)
MAQGASASSSRRTLADSAPEPGALPMPCSPLTSRSSARLSIGLAAAVAWALRAPLLAAPGAPPSSPDSVVFPALVDPTPVVRLPSPKEEED